MRAYTRLGRRFASVETPVLVIAMKPEVGSLEYSYGSSPAPLGPDLAERSERLLTGIPTTVSVERVRYCVNR